MIQQGDYIRKIRNVSEKSTLPNEIYYLIFDIVGDTLEVHEMKGRPLPFESVYGYDDIVADGYTIQIIKDYTMRTITQQYDNHGLPSGIDTGVEFSWHGKTYIKQIDYYYNGKEFIKYPDMAFLK